MISYSFYEGDTRIIQYAQALVNRGDEVDVISLRGRAQGRRGSHNGVRVFRIQKRTYTEARFLLLLRILLFLFRSMCMVAWRHWRSPYDVIHVHSVPDFLVFAAWVPKLMGAALILDIHDVLPEFYASKFNIAQTSMMFRMLLAIERVSCAFAKHVIVANDLWRLKVEARARITGKCSAFLNYPDRSRFSRRERSRSVGNNFRIVYPGSLNRHQGVDVAIRAFALVKEEIAQAEFHIYGEGGARESLVALVDELGLRASVLFHDLVPLDEIVPIMASADLAVVPKRSDSFGNEAFSTKILQFMFLGVPIVASDTQIDRYYFNDAVLRFFRAGDPDDLAFAILQLARDSALCQRMAEEAYEFAGHFDWNTKQKEYFRLIESLVPRRPAILA